MKLDWKTCIRIGITIFLLYLGITYWPSFAHFVKVLVVATVPLMLGGVIAYVLNILMRFYEGIYFPNSKNPRVIKSRRAVCLILSLLTLALIVALFVVLVFPQVIESVKTIINGIPNAINFIAEKLKGISFIQEEWIASFESIDWRSKIDKIITTITMGVGNAMGMVVNVVSSVLSRVITVALGFIFAIYILFDKERIGAQLNRVMKTYMSDTVYTETKYVMNTLDSCFSSYIVGQCIDALILGGLCTLGMIILKIPYAVMTGGVIAFTALIPVAGAYIGAFVGVFMIMTVSPIKAVIFVIFLIILQQLEGNLIYPRIMGSSMGLPSIWVLAAVTIGGGVMGVLGMLIAVPIATAIYRILKDDVRRREKNMTRVNYINQL